MNFAKRIGNLADGCISFHGLQDEWHQIGGPGGSRFEFSECRFNSRSISICAGASERLNLRSFELWINHVDRNRFHVIGSKLVDADDNALPGFDRSLILVRGFLYLALNPSRLDSG